MLTVGDAEVGDIVTVEGVITRKEGCYSTIKLEFALVTAERSRKVKSITKPVKPLVVGDMVQYRNSPIIYKIKAIIGELCWLSRLDITPPSDFIGDLTQYKKVSQ